jgi:hypothetical protein
VFNKRSKKPKFTVGETVRILPEEAISKLVDPRTKALDGCLFMEQMGDYCGNTYRILSVVDSFYNEHQHRTFEPKSPMYLLEGLICNGKVSEFPAKCDRRCFLLWHEQWLGRPDQGPSSQLGACKNPSSLSVGSTKCQLQLIDELGDKNTWLNEKLEFSVMKFIDYRRKIRSNLHARNHIATSVRISQDEIRPGDLVRVRTAEEIRGTLDRFRKTKGCGFADRMYEYCGKEFRVVEKVDNFFDESRQKFCKCKGVLLLEGSYCDGKTPYLRPCDRKCFYFWHVNWLERV